MTESIQTVAVIGAGAMGAGIAQVAAQSGYQTILFDLAEGKAEQAKAEIAARLDKKVSRNKMSAVQRDEIVQSIKCSTELQSVSSADLVIEAIVEDLQIKQGLFRDLEAICAEECMLATNTSSISVTSIASALNKPDRFVGLHFFNPAPLMALVEVVRGIETSDEVCSRAKGWAESCGKRAVVTRSLPGFIVNRVARPFYAEALRALEVNVAPIQDIDYCLTKTAQFRMGPFELMDLIGHDVNYAVTKSVYDAYYQDRRFTPSLIQKELVDAGLLGRKSGRGFYDYTGATEKPEPNFAKPCALTDSCSVTLYSDGNLISDFAQLTGLTAEKADSAYLDIDGVYVAFTQGITASQLSDQLKQPVVLMDYCQSYMDSEVIILAAADQNSTEQTEKAVAYFQSKGKQVMLLDDYPGLIVWRTWCMLINEALDLANQNGASLEDIDIAMKSGVNYPFGPVELGESLGWNRVLTTLNHLQSFYGEERYRSSPLLRRLSLNSKKGN
ncbi:3-hydroxyacyl-CoA dehydrogenase [Vibrio sp. SCSIO 43137]|uniref:3-hydroxyacyl-CoA dehydrogenase n=1 Tax=Vibrio sp. SCSIO 43137 TaxID=3021011 RepID=UPI0023073B32|nr:3-hydroxyacyl-CoA dehydrogenase [Vibrio sp. SCSIO 43137]WCE30907.1 3-hydroxyacyl-CoA dehydrogenase [Vibrio sp. SCSIO 43137]